MIEITTQSVIEGLTAIVDEFGEDYVYPEKEAVIPRCLYVHDGEPDCIVGKFLHSVGIPLERLKKADEVDGGTPAWKLLGQLEDERVLTAEDRGLNILQRAQDHQDSGIAWGEALRRAMQ